MNNRNWVKMGGFVLLWMMGAPQAGAYVTVVPPVTSQEPTLFAI